jgi:hypothetical protein
MYQQILPIDQLEVYILIVQQGVVEPKRICAKLVVVKLCVEVKNTLNKMNTSQQSTFNTQMRVLVLVISSDNFPVYALHRDVWRTYMKSHPNIDCFFIQYNPLVFVPILTNDTLTLRGQERYSTVLAKTVDALAYLLPRRPYTHIVRTNLSSVWNFSRLIEVLASLPSQRLYGGLPLGKGGASGAGILWTRDVAELLIANRKTLLSIGTADDDDIGTFLQAVGVPLTITHRVDFLSLAHYIEHNDKIPPGSFHYRVKQPNPEHRLNEEPEMMRRILREHIYTDSTHKVFRVGNR